MKLSIFFLLIAIALPFPVYSNTYCPTPELKDLDTWSKDFREGAQNAGLDVAFSGCTIDNKRQKILFIGVDGLRVDAAAMLPLPNFRRLERMGTFSYWANVQYSATAVSGPGWTSMFTGTEPIDHKVDGNGDLTDVAHPTVFKLVKTEFPDMRIAAAVSWHPLLDEIIDHEDPNTLSAQFKSNNYDDDAVTEEAKTWIESGNYDFVFVNFDACDGAGHSSGFDGYASIYGNAVTKTDERIGKLLDAVLERSSGEEWLIVLTSDHGGEGRSHGASTPEHRRVPLIVASNSPRVSIGRAPHNDPGSQMDPLPTIMHFLGKSNTISNAVDGQVFGFRDYQRTPPQECVSDPETCGCGLQTDYRGTKRTTVSGLECQAWDSQEPHSHTLTPDKYPSAGLESNYCRNPDGEPGAWCYTTSKDTRWELCGVRDCREPPKECVSDPETCGCGDQIDYRGTKRTTASGLECQAWDSQEPHSHSRTSDNYPGAGLESNYCRNPDGEPGAWCYTTSKDRRWELCGVPDCQE